MRLAIAAGVAALAGAALFVLELDNPAFSTARLTLVVSVGLLMVAAGLVAMANGEDRIGVLVVLAGGGWLVERLLRAIPNGLTATISALLTGLWLAFLVHAIVTFPSGRPASPFGRALVGFGYLVNLVLNVPYLLVGPSLDSSASGNATSSWSPPTRTRPAGSARPPNGSPWAGPPRSFKELTDRRLRRGAFSSVPDLLDAIYDSAHHWNADPKPFVWHKTAEEIITKVRRGRSALTQAKSATHH